MITDKNKTAKLRKDIQWLKVTTENKKKLKKPKKEKVKVSATANSLAGKPAIGTKK